LARDEREDVIGKSSDVVNMDRKFFKESFGLEQCDFCQPLEFHG
jgi:hypothetical protein